MTHPRELADFLEKEILVFTKNLTIEETVAALKRNRENVARVSQEAAYAYVADEEGRLEGVLQMRDLILNPAKTPIEEIMKKSVVSLRKGMSPEEMLEVFKKHSFLALPVVDEKGKLLGAVNFSRLVPLFEKKTGAALYQATGIDPSRETALFPPEELSHRSILRMLLLRSPWLVLSIFSGLAAAFILGNYFVGIESIISLILFIPIVLGLSGSVARQGAVMVTHEFAKGGAAASKLIRILAKETLLAAFAGLLTLVSVGLIALILNKSLMIALAIGSAIFLAILCSGFLGVFFPFLFAGLRLDPKIASGPLTVAVCDLLALWIYLQVAYFFLSPRG